MKYMVNEYGASQNTIKSYRDTFVQFISYMDNAKGIKVQRLTLASITKEFVISFLDWIQAERKCSVSTRNNRLAAIHSFFKYVQYHCPDNLFEYQRILSIKIKKQVKAAINYLTLDGVRLLLNQPDILSPKGIRDLALLSLMYDSGARVQEIADLSVQDVHLEPPYSIKIMGKGKKIRIVPLMKEQTEILRNYMIGSKLMLSQNMQHPLFFNNRNEHLTRGGITHIFLKYVRKARECNSTIIPTTISCHSLRHSKAMHLLQAGVNLVYIRDILGHVSIQTTEGYARADSKQKREAIEKAYSDVAPITEPIWENNNNLLDWLKSF